MFEETNIIADFEVKNPYNFATKGLYYQPFLLL
jgi:hypothetical protein